MDPRHVLSAVLDDPPRIHGPDAPNGVWRTATECYEFLIDEVPKGSRTLETGMGVSTVLFAALETEHTSVSMGDATEELLSWCDEHDVPTSRLRLVNESSVTALPRIATEPDPLDVVFIDGCHGYPVVQLDWLYGCARLRDGGTVVVDDTQLPAPHELRKFLKADPRWETVHSGYKWSAFRRLGTWDLSEDYYAQSFWRTAHEPWRATLRRRVPARLERPLTRLIAPRRR
jgi:hypothetical protein